MVVHAWSRLHLSSSFPISLKLFESLLIGFLRRHYLLILIGSAAAIRLVIAWLPLEYLLRTVLNDDTFYYLTIARNTAFGAFYSFDGLSPTNGFHALWLRLLVPLFLFVRDDVTVLHLALTLCAVFDTAAIYVLSRLLRLLRIGDGTMLLVCSLVAFAPAVLSNAGPMNGMETAANSFLLILFLYYFVRINLEEIAGKYSWLLFGTITGLVMLSRTDNAIVVGVCYLAVALSLKDRLRWLAGAAGVAILLLLPWFIWSYRVFGTIAQVSGEAGAHTLKSYLALNSWSAAEYSVQLLKNIALVLTHFPVHLYDVSLRSPLYFIVASAVIGYLVWALVSGWRVRAARSILRHQLTVWRGPIVALLLFIVIHTLHGIYLKSWYYASIIPILLVPSAIVLNFCFTTRHRSHTMQIVLLLLVFSAANLTYSPRRIGEIDKYTMVGVLDGRLPAGARVGSWNAGVYGYFSSRLQIVNLDGLVNNVVFDSIKQREVHGYCVANKIEYIVDSRGSLRFNSLFWKKDGGPILKDLVLIDSVYGTKERDWIVIGKIIR